MAKLLILLLSAIVLVSCVKNVNELPKGQKIQDFSNIQHTNWKNIASSSIILIGTLTAPVKEITKKRRIKKNKYIDIKLSGIKYLKNTGIADKSIYVKYYTKKPRLEGYKVKLSTLRRFNGKRVIAYIKSVRVMKDMIITSGGETKLIYKNELYFLHSPNAISDAKNSKEIINEIKHQKYLADQELPSKLNNEKLNNRVKLLIEMMLKKRTAKKAYTELQKIGKEGTPYIIRHMNDYRKLPVQSISLVNTSPNSFEGLRHYSPKVVVDVLSAILSQIEKQSFYPSISNGGSQTQRENEVNAWKIWLFHRKSTS